MEKFEFHNHERSIKFTGELLLKEYSSSNNASSCYSGQSGKRNEIELYKTGKNNFVIVHSYLTQWQGDQDETLFFVGEDLKKLIDQIPESRCKKWFVTEVHTKKLIEADEV